MPRPPRFHRAPRPGRLRRLLGLLVAAGVLAIGAAVIGAPIFLPGALERLAAGRGIPLSVAGARVDWAERRVRLMDARLGDPHAPSLAWDSVQLGLDWRALAAGRIALSHVGFRGIRFDPEALTRMGSAAGGLDALVSWLSRLGDVEIGATDLPWLTSALGAPVRLERMRCRALDALAAGEEGECELFGTLGRAPLELTARLRVHGEALRYQGTLRADGFELERLQGLLGADAARPLEHAVAHANARLDGSFLPGEGLFDARGDVTVTLAEFAGAGAAGSLGGHGLSWRGSVDVGWSRILGLVAARARGVLEADRVRITGTANGALAGASVEANGLTWRGGVDLAGSVPVFEGVAQVARVSATAAGGAWSAEIAGLSARGGLQGDPDAGGLSLDRLGARSVEVLAPVLGDARGAVLDGLEVESLVRDAAGAWHAARVAATRLVAMGTVTTPGGQGRAWRLPDVSAVGVTLHPDGRIDAARLEAPRAELRLAELVTRARNLSAEDVSSEVPLGVSARRLTAREVETVTFDHQARYEEVEFTTATLRATGAVSLRDQRVARASVVFTSGSRWALTDLRSRALRTSPSGASAVDGFSAASMRFEDVRGVSGTLEELSTQMLGISPDGRLAAERAEIAAFSVSAETSRWHGREIILLGPGLEPGRRVDTRRAELASISVSRPGEMGLTLDQLVTERLGGESIEALAADTLSFDKGRIARRGDTELDMGGFRAGAIAWRGANGLAIGEATLDRARWRAPGGRVVEGEKFRAHDAAWERDVFAAADLGVERYFGTGSGGVRWATENVTTSGFEYRAKPGEDVISAGEARMSALTVEREAHSAARLDSPEFQALRWRLGELPSMRSGRVASASGRVAQLEWRFGPAEVTDGTPDDVRFDVLQLRGLALGDAGTGLDLSADVVRLRNGHVQDWPAVEAGAFEADALRVAGPGSANLGFVQVAWLHGTEARVDIGKTLDLGELVLSGLDVGIGIDPGGRRVWPELDPRKFGLRPERVRIARASTEGLARIVYVDHSVRPQVELRLEPVNAVMRDFDTSRPDRPGEFELRARTGGAGTFEVRGIVKPSFDTIDIDAAVSGRGLDLTRLSPWAVHYHGVQITGGRADADLDVRVESQSVDGNAKILVDSLTLAPPAREGRPGSFGEAGREVGGTLAMLEDTDGRISLEVPFSGTLADPRFRLSGIFAQALANTATNAVLLALKPIGLIAGGLLNGLGGAHFAPIEFAPGEVSLSAADLVALEDLSKTLAERPRMQVKVCGKATASDREALQRPYSHPGRLPVLLGGAGVTPSYTAAGLARRRGEATREWLLATGRVAREQLPRCAPVVDASAGASPRVELLLARAPPQRPRAALDRDEVEMNAR